MPNPTKKLFRRPAVRRCRKVASKTFKKICPERGYYDGPQYRERGGLADWVGKQHEPPKAYMGGSHSQQMHPSRSRGRTYPQGGYMPCASRPAIPAAAFEPATSMSNVSECLTDDSRYSARGKAKLSL